jgi:hypothetical protein
MALMGISGGFMIFYFSGFAHHFFLLNARFTFLAIKFRILSDLPFLILLTHFLSHGLIPLMETKIKINHEPAINGKPGIDFSDPIEKKKAARWGGLYSSIRYSRVPDLGL